MIFSVFFSASLDISPFAFETASSLVQISSTPPVGVTSDSLRFIGTVGVTGNAEEDVEGVAAGVTPVDEVECVNGTEC